MKCFNHTTADAIGICKHCSKGLCIECAVDLGYGITHRGNCETETRSLHIMVQRSTNAYQVTGKSFSQNAIWLSLLGLFSLVLAISLVRVGGILFWFSLIFGLLMLVGAFFSYRSSRGFRRD